MELHKPKNLYELLTLNMEQRFANRVAFRWYDADQDVVVEKHFGEYAQDIRRAVNYYLSTIPDIQGKRVCVWSNNSYHYAVNCYGVMMAGGVIVPMNQRICAVVCCEADQQDAVRDFVTKVNRTLPLYKHMMVEFSAQPLPRNAAGKLLRS